MYVCMFAWMYVRMYVRMYAYFHMYIEIWNTYTSEAFSICKLHSSRQSAPAWIPRAQDAPSEPPAFMKSISAAAASCFGGSA